MSEADVLADILVAVQDLGGRIDLMEENLTSRYETQQETLQTLTDAIEDLKGFVLDGQRSVTAEDGF